MLSKEEIKNIKEIKDMLDYASMCVHSNLQLDNESSKLLCTYIEQLETNNKKLIEKLEERRKQNNNRYGQAIDDDEFPEMYEYSGQVQEDDYILKILKGEKE